MRVSKSNERSIQTLSSTRGSMDKFVYASNEEDFLKTCLRSATSLASVSLDGIVPQLGALVWFKLLDMLSSGNARTHPDRRFISV